MKLAQYLETKKITDGEFAEKIGVSLQAVHRYKNGQRFPRPEHLSKIQEVTGGRVTANDFIVGSARASA